MITKGNDAKVQNEVMAQIVADTSAKWMKFTRLLPKQEIEENSQYYTYMSQRVNIEEAIQSGVLGEAKDIAPGERHCSRCNPSGIKREKTNQ